MAGARARHGEHQKGGTVGAQSQYRKDGELCFFHYVILMTKTSIARIVRGLLTIGRAWFQGLCIQSKADLTGLFGQSRVDEVERQVTRRKVFLRNSGSMAHRTRDGASFVSLKQPGGGTIEIPASTPEASSSKFLSYAFFNPGHIAGERLEEILRFFAEKGLVILSGTSRGMRRYPPGAGFVDSSTPHRKEYWVVHGMLSTGAIRAPHQHRTKVVEY